MPSAVSDHRPSGRAWEIERYIAAFDTRRLPRYHMDVLVVGAGAAGAMCALAAANSGADVGLLAKAGLGESNTVYAQGGVAVALESPDTWQSHVADTLSVGRGLCEPAVVERIVRGGPEVLARLIGLGAEFDRTAGGDIDLVREGGHSHARIVHAGGAATGQEIQRALGLALRRTERIAVFERCFALDLLFNEDGRVGGVLAQTSNGERVVFSAREVVLATGGGGQIYRETTNPSIATGDGVAMAVRAGARARDLEFFQFHPTCLYIAGAARVLISETVRGAGARLVDREGHRFMLDVDRQAELAPRDVVSRACFERMVQTGDTNVYLDLSELNEDPHRVFPGISRICKTFGIDIARDPIPVRPGAHYMIGGIWVDADGRTSVPGLWAVGECASSGLHGANRMGSNSLLEGLVMGAQVGDAAAAERGRYADLLCVQRESRQANPDVRLSLEDMTYSLKSLFWRQMGIVRSGSAIADALDKLHFWGRAVQRLAPEEPKAFELLNMLLVARLAAQAALTRAESRGAHYRSDFPSEEASWRKHSLLEPRLADGRVSIQLCYEPVAALVAP